MSSEFAVLTRADSSYALQAIRLSALRYSDDSITPRIISLDPSFALNPYVAASGLSDIDRWPEITRALDSPPPDHGYSSTDSDGGVARAGPSSSSRNRSAGGLSYTQTIMGNKSGGLGMRVAGRRTGGKRDKRANSGGVTPSRMADRSPSKTPREKGVPTIDVFSPNGGTGGRPRSDSAPAPVLLGPESKVDMGSVITSGRGLGGVDATIGQGGLLEQAVSMSEISTTEDGVSDTRAGSSMVGVAGTGLGDSGRPSDSVIPDGLGLGETLMDDDELASDLDEDPGEEEEDEDIGMGIALPGEDGGEDRRKSILLASQRSSYINDLPPLQFPYQPIGPVAPSTGPAVSGLTAQLYKHVPHLVSTTTETEDEHSTLSNPFASLYASVSAHPPQPSLSLELFFPHSSKPTLALVVVVRKDATVEEVTGYGLYKYWEEGREPLLSDGGDDEQKWSTVGWGLRIVEDDGEVDEDFPRESAPLAARRAS